jgi:hypothetical protein
MTRHRPPCLRRTRADERAANAALYPRSGNVIAAPVLPPVKDRDDHDRRSAPAGAQTRRR